MNHIILGNAVALLGAAVMAAIGLIKERKHIIAAQCVQFGIMAAANLILGGITGAAASLISITRNLICLKSGLTAPIKIIIILVQTAFSLGANKSGLIGILPGLSACLCTWFLDVKDAVKLKLVLIIAQSCWVVYDFYILNYVGFAFDIMSVIANAVGIITIVKQRIANSDIGQVDDRQQ